jgi:hypothetical protein
LGLDLWVNGYPILVDPGNATYNLDDPWGQYFPDPGAHNTIVVDNLPAFVSRARWRNLLPDSYKKAAALLALLGQETQDIKFEMELHGYQRLSPPLTIKRTVTVRAEQELLVQDYLNGPGSHQVEVYWQFGDNRLVPGPSPLIFEVSAPDGKMVASVRFSSDRELSVHVNWGTTKPAVSGWYSPCYGAKREATTAIVRFIIDGPSVIETRLAFNRPV